MRKLFLILSVLWSPAAFAEDWKALAANIIGNDVDDVYCLGWQDARGTYTKVSLQVRNSVCFNDLTKPKESAFFVVADKGRGVRDLWVFFKRDGQLTPVLTTMLSSERVRPINAIVLKKNKQQGDYLDISMHQTVMPLPGDRIFRPGPPLESRFVFDGTAYEPFKRPED